MAPPIEILVHISGPSRGSDDARYRREARNYLQFEVGTRHVLLSNKDRENGDNEGDEDDEDNETNEDIGETDQDGESDYGDCDFSQFETPGPKIAPPALPMVGNYEGNSLQQARENFWRTPVTSKSKALRSFDNYTPGSAPVVKHPFAVQVSRTPVIQVVRTPSDQRPNTAPTSAKSSPEIPYFCSSQSDSWGPSPNEVPDSQPSLPNLKRPLGSSSPSPQRRSTSRSPKRQRRSPSPSLEQLLQINDSPSLPAGSPIYFRSSPLPPASPPPPTPKSSRTPRSPMAIRPNPPAPDIAHFKTHLTPPLELLITHLPLVTFFSGLELRPATRSLRIHERGHWRLSTSSFAPDLKIKAWSYLQEFIGEGRAGWGVWCVIETEPRAKRRLGTDNKKREEEEKKGGGAEVGEVQQPPAGDPLSGHGNDGWRTATQMDIDEAEPPPPPPTPAQEIWKFYCWGEQVPAIWLLIFIATNRKAKGCAAAWLDSREETVVLMK